MNSNPREKIVVCVVIVFANLLLLVVFLPLFQETTASAQEVPQFLFAPSDQQWREYVREIEKIRVALESIAESQKRQR
ncbi:MAG: hypothetical protein WDA09_06145 [Bacteriovoracaceae bacterium]